MIQLNRVCLWRTNQTLALVRFPSEDLNAKLWANNINVLTHWNSHGILHSVLTIHILFVIGALCTYQSNVSINEIDYKEDSLYKVH